MTHDFTFHKVTLPEFYLVDFTATLAEAWSEYAHWECAVCGRYPGDRVGHSTIRFRKRSEIADFVQTSGGLLSRTHLVELLYMERLTGWRQGRVDVLTSTRVRDLPLEYSELVVVGRPRCLFDRIGIEPAFTCEVCGRTRYPSPMPKIWIPFEAWDKSDMFMIKEYGRVVVTARFREVVLNNNLTGLDFTLLQPQGISVQG